MDKKLVGVLLVVAGAGLAWWGYDVSRSVQGQFLRAWSGSLPDKAVVLYILGACAVASGVFLLGRRK
jgi:hypothetical protein